MAEALKDRRWATRQARRIFRAQLRRALNDLAAARPSDADIHAARRNLKKARATLRLLRRVLPRALYQRADRALRNAARPLSAARDARVLMDAFDALWRGGRRAASLVAHAAAVRRRLELARRLTRRAVTTRRSGVARSRKLIRAVRRRAADWPARSKGWGKLLMGLTRLYQQGRETLEEVRAAPITADLHRWRKRAKYLYHQLELLQPASAAPLGRLIRRLHRLSDHLGDDHDLAVLGGTLAAVNPRLPASAAFESELTRRIDRARANLQRRALALGARLYQDEPARFRARVRSAGRRGRG